MNHNHSSSTKVLFYKSIFLSIQVWMTILAHYDYLTVTSMGLELEGGSKVKMELK